MNIYTARIDGMEYSGYVREIVVDNNCTLRFHEGSTEHTYENVKGRLNCFFSKEPETIHWIKTTMNPKSVFWDIGANIGQYGILASGLHRCKTYLFEPEAQNFSTIAFNVKLNELRDTIHFPIALSDKREYSTIKVPTMAGCSNISIEKDHRIKQGVWTDTIDNLVREGISSPTHLKIDVDGVELRILEGAKETLGKVESVLIETASEDIDTVVNILSSYGFNNHSLHKRLLPNLFNIIFTR